MSNFLKINIKYLPNYALDTLRYIKMSKNTLMLSRAYSLVRMADIQTYKTSNNSILNSVRTTTTTKFRGSPEEEDIFNICIK